MSAAFDQDCTYKCRVWSVLGPWTWNLTNHVPISVGLDLRTYECRTDPLLMLWVSILKNLCLWMLIVINVGPMRVELDRSWTREHWNRSILAPWVSKMLNLHSMGVDLDQSWACEYGFWFVLVPWAWNLTNLEPMSVEKTVKLFQSSPSEWRLSKILSLRI